MKLMIFSVLMFLIANYASADILKAEFIYSSAGQALLDHFSSDVSSRGALLKVENHWDVDILNGFAKRDGAVWIIETHGGLYRSPLISNDGYMAFLCHELGHHLGGAPFKPDISWMSTEGQADYFSGSTCLKKIWRDEDNLKVVSQLLIPEGLKPACLTAGFQDGALALCLRIGMAGFSFVEFNRVEHGYQSESVPVDFNSPAQYFADHYSVYPRAQCRLDTFLAAATGRERPRCWYIP